MNKALLLLLLLAPGIPVMSPVFAEEDTEEEFDTDWLGARLGIWYRPEMKMKVQISGPSLSNPIAVIPGTDLDIEKDLGVTQNVESDYLFQQGILEAEVFFDSRFISLSLWGVMPFEYRGDTVRSITIDFAGVSFTAGTRVESTFRQWLAAADVKVNIFNNKYFRISPLVGLRFLGIDWEVSAVGLRGDTTDIDSPFKIDDDQVLPYPELGIEARVGIRRWFEVDGKLSGTYVSYFGFEGGSLTAELGGTVYPISNIGARLGFKLVQFDFESKNSLTDDDFFDLELQYFGVNFSILARF